MTAGTLAIKDANNANQSLITNVVSGNQMPVHNIGDPTSGNSASVVGSALSIVPTAQSSGGSGTPYFNDAVAGTVQQIKSSQGNLYMLDLVNTLGTTAYLQIFYLPSASVTLGSTAASQTIRLAGNASKTLELPVPMGSTGTGLSIAGTTGASNSTGSAISVSAIYA